MNNNNVDIKITAKDLAKEIRKNLIGDLKEIGVLAKESGNKGSMGFAELTGAIAIGTTAAQGFIGIIGTVTSSIGSLISSVIDLGRNFFDMGFKGAQNIEQLEIAFTTMLGSADKARGLINELVEAAKKTPFELPELQKASKSLLAFGVDAKEIIPTLLRLGDVSAGIGANVGEIAEIYGKAKVQGRLFAEDINQLTGRGIPIIQELAKQFKVSESNVKKLVEDGKVGFPQLEQAFKDLTKEGSKFGGLMEQQSASLGGIISNLSDTLNTLSTEFFKNSGLMDIFKIGAQGLVSILGFLADKLAIILSGLREGFGQALPLIQIQLGNLQETISEVFGQFATEGDTLKNTFIDIGNVIGNLVAQAISFVKGFVDGFGQRTQEIRNALDGLGIVVASFFSILKGNTEEGIKKFDALGNVVGGNVAGAIASVITKLTELLQWVFDNKEEIKRFINELVGLARLFYDIVKVVSVVIGELSKLLSVISEIKKTIDSITINPIKGLVEGIQNPQGRSTGKSAGLGGYIPKFATGGNFVVPPGFPNDSFPMRVSSGEHVQVTPVGGTTNNKNMNITNNIYSNNIDTGLFTGRMAFYLGL